MGVTIDSIQIEIQSGSTNATQGIDALATSLERLKKSGTLTTVIKNLNGLSVALKGFSDASKSSTSLRTLAGAIERLKSVGSVTSIANSLTKLQAGLKSIESVNMDNVAPQIQRIANAVIPLSTVNTRGFNSMINSLSKLEKVTASLDDDKIAAFAEKVKRLNAVLEPLSGKMTTLQAGFQGLNTAVRQTTISVEHANAKVDVSIFNFSNLANSISAVHSVLQSAAQGFAKLVNSAAQWDGISARFGKGFGAQAQETYEWIQRLNEEMGINVQQFMQYSSVYATMLTGFGVANEDASKMALGYAELTYDIWAGYNDIYKSFDDAAEAVRSAIAGEVEPIRRAGFTIIESTLEQTAANHGLEISLESATEAQKSYLRYLTLVDQAHSQNLIGTYAKEMNTAEGLMRTLTQQFKSLTQAFGSLFLPILVKVLPYVQAFVELLTEGVQAFAALFGITIQGVEWGDYNAGASDAIENTEGVTGALNDATAAAKELKNASIGIDELNVISPQSAASGGGSGGGGTGGTGFENLDVDSLWDESIFKDINSQVDAIKEKFEGWLPVIKTIGGLLSALGIATLLSSLGKAMETLGEMDGVLGTLKKTLAGLAILTIEAVMVFMLADEYLESGNLLALIGEALATAAGGYLMYKGFGTKGLAFALGVSILAQLVAITMNLADGGVDFTDPQLWIQAAFTTAMAGVGGGILAYKGLIPVSTGKGVGLGLLAGLSLTLAAITIGEVTANGGVTKESVLTGIGSVLAAAGFGFMIGGPYGAVIGAVAGLTVNIVGAAIGEISASAKEKMEKDLSERFGDVELSIGEIRVIIDKLLPEWSDAVIDATELRDSVNAIGKEIEKQVATINSYEWRVSVGIGLSEEEAEKYRATIDSFISSCQAYVDDRNYALVVGLKATGATDSIVASAEEISSSASSELDRLGKELQETINTAYEDGLLDIDELKAIQTIRNDMLAITNALKSSEIESEFGVLEMKWSGVDLTPESFTSMMVEWNDTIQNKVKPALESTVKENLKTLEGNVAFAKMQVDKDPTNKAAKEALANAEKALQEYMDANPLEELTLEANIKAVTFGLNTIKEAYAAEIERVQKEGHLDFDEKLELALTVAPGVKFDDGDGDIYGNIELLTANIQRELKDASYSLSKEARKTLLSMLESLEPTMEDFEKLAEESRKSGTTVVQSVRDGLNDYNEMKALTGDVDAINYLVGKGFSTDATFLNTLATSKNAGSQITGSVREGLLNNLSYVTDEATGLVTGIKNSITGEVVAVTPTLKANMEQMGVTLSTGVLAGAETEMADQKKSWKDWAIWPWNWFKETNEIHSPSKVFERGGKDIVAGLVKGISTGALKDRLSEMWKNAKTWWDEKKGNLKTYTPSIGSIYEKVKERWDNARTWWNSKKSAMKSYTPSIGSIYEKVAERWKNARDWWNSKKSAMKTYTPSIGSIVDKVKSAWNTAKNWWNKNVKLSTKLNIQVPTIKVKWDTASAFGKEFRYPTGFKLEFAANGGIFDQGSLIWAGERGPEVMATAAGGRTGVMNVQQMQDAVYEGVYAAVSAAMRGNTEGGTQAVNVYLDGKQITAAVEKRQHERGASIMGNAVYSY